MAPDVASDEQGAEQRSQNTDPRKAPGWEYQRERHRIRSRTWPQRLAVRRAREGLISFFILSQARSPSRSGSWIICNKVTRPHCLPITAPTWSRPSNVERDPRFTRRPRRVKRSGRRSCYANVFWITNASAKKKPLSDPRTFANAFSTSGERG